MNLRQGALAIRSRVRAAEGNQTRGIPRRGSLRRRVLILCAEHATLLIVVLVSLFPLYLMFIASLTPTADFSGSSLLPPGNPTFAAYARAWNDLGFDTMFVNSTILSLASGIGTTAIAAGAAYGFTRFRFAGRAVLLAAMIGMMAIPAVAIIVPLFILMAQINWVNTYQGGIIAEIALLLPLSVFLLYSFMKDLPSELFEAAAVDGASTWRQFWEIALPMARPAIVTSLVISVIYAWNDLLIPLVLWQSSQLQTLMVGLSALGPGRSGARDIPTLMAGVTISIAPLLVLFIFARRAIVAGLVEGADR